MPRYAFLSIFFRVDNCSFGEPYKPEFAFFQIQPKKYARNAVILPQMALTLVPEVLNAVDMVMPINIAFEMINAIVFKFR